MVYISIIVFERKETNHRVATFFVSEFLNQCSGMLVEVTGTRGKYMIGMAPMDDPVTQEGYVILITIGNPDISRTKVIDAIRSVGANNDDEEWNERRWARTVLRRMEYQQIISPAQASFAWETTLLFLEAVQPPTV